MAIDLKIRSYDAIGNTLETGINQSFEYDDRNWMVEAKENDTTILSNQYNGRGERVQKTTSSGSRLFMYNQRATDRRIQRDRSSGSGICMDG